MAEDYSAADPLSQPVTPDPVPTKPSAVHNIFVGPNGIRAGWRLVIFLALDFAFVYGIVHIPGVRSLLPPQQIFTAKGLLFSEGLLNLLPLLLAAAVMTFIEKRSFADYGMPWNETLGKRFWQGVPIGFIMLSLLLLLIGALHGFSLDGVGSGRSGCAQPRPFIFHRLHLRRDVRGILLSRIHAINSPVRYRILAGGNHSLDCFRRYPPRK